MYAKNLVAIVVSSLMLLVFTGCSFEIEPNTRMAGQECVAHADCVEGYRCIERRCRPSSVISSPGDAGPVDAGDTGGDDAGGPVNSTEPPLDAGIDVGDGECIDGQRQCRVDFRSYRICEDGSWQHVQCDPGDLCLDGYCRQSQEECTLGQSRCRSNTSIQICVATSDGNFSSGVWHSVACPQDFSCDDGVCTSDSPSACQAGSSTCLDDQTPAFCTGDAWELLGNCGPNQYCSDASCFDEPTDDCCPNGCGSQEVCDGCTCKGYDPALCQYQDQPCTTEGQISNNFICSDYGGTQLRCFGICNPNSAVPDSTCPGTDEAACLHDPGAPTGYCLKACDLNDQCTDSRMRCVNYDIRDDADGACLPTTGVGGVGDSCNPDNFFSCAGNNICVGGLCQQACRPFAGGDTDCTQGNFCLPFDSRVGMCAPNSEGANGTCSAEFTACSADGTGCFMAFNSNQLICYEFCRLAQSNEDCPAGDTCWQHDQNNNELGMCVSPP